MGNKIGPKGPDPKQCLSCKRARDILKCAYKFETGNCSDSELDTLVRFYYLPQPLTTKDKKERIQECLNKSKGGESISAHSDELCDENIHTVICSLHWLLQEDMVDSIKDSTKNIPLLREMCRLVAENSLQEEDKIFAKEVKLYVQKLRNLDIAPNSDEGHSPDDLNELRVETVIEILKQESFSDSELDYLSRTVRFIIKKYIDLEDTSFGDETECFLRNTREYISFHQEIADVREAKAKESLKFENTLSGLNENDRDFLKAYCLRLPIVFGVSLAKIMEEEDYSDSDLAHMLSYVDGIKVTATDILRMKDRIAAPDDPKMLRALCRALLVDEDALRRGYGKSYGSFKNYIEDRGIIDDTITAGFKPDGKKMSEFKAKNYMRDFIAKNIISKDVTTEQMLTDFCPDKQTKEAVFPEKHFSAFENISDRIYYLYDKEAVYILADILKEKM